MAFSSALVIFAHPDDAEFMAGGTIARWVREGTEVHYCCITDGSAGSNEPGVTREQVAPVRLREQRAAAEVLGVRQVHFLGYVDGMIEVTFDLRRDVTRVVRTVRPEVILAPDPQRLWFGSGYVNHWDHKVAGTVALCAVMPDSPTRAQFPELLEEGTETVLEEVGLSYFCYVIPRWHTIAGSVYGVSMATSIILPDGRTMQVMVRTIREAGEKAVDPPMLAITDAIRGDIALYAGGVTTADMEYDERLGEVLRPVTQIKDGMPVGLQLVAPPLDEARLLKVAHHFQKVTDWHQRMPGGYE